MFAEPYSHVRNGAKDKPACCNARAMQGNPPQSMQCMMMMMMMMIMIIIIIIITTSIIITNIIIIIMQITRFLDHCLISALHSSLGSSQAKARSQKSTFDNSKYLYSGPSNEGLFLEV